MRIGSLFSGIGGLELGLEWAGLGSVVWQVEKDAFCREVLAKHWPEARRHKDVREVAADELVPVDILCGGFPCQDVSVAGRGEGLDGDRSGLWFEFLRLVRELRPAAVVVENVPGLLRRGLDVVVGGLRGASYAVEGTIIGADDVGAPHRRKRLFLLAYADSEERRWSVNGGSHVAHPCSQRRQGERAPEARWDQAPLPEETSPAMGYPLRPGRAEGGGMGAPAGTPSLGAGSGPPQPGVGGVADGLSARLDGARWPAGRGVAQHPWEAPRTVASRSLADRAARVKALGNAVCPQVAYVVGCRVRQVLVGGAR